MKKLFQLSALALLMLCFSKSLLAQNKNDKPTKKNEVKKITIESSNDTGKPMAIQIDGDHITINGKSLEDFLKENQNVDIKIRKFKDKDALQHQHNDAGDDNGDMQNWNFNFNDDECDVEHSPKPLLGVMTSQNNNDNGDNGVLIEEVMENSAAQKAGLQKGDIITKVDDEKIDSPEDLASYIQSKKPGDEVMIDFTRGNKADQVKAILEKGKQPQRKVFMYKNKKGDDFDMLLPKINEMQDKFRTFKYKFDTERPRLGVSIEETENGNGVKILSVKKDGLAEKSGLKEGDIITSVNKKNIASVEDVFESLKESKDGSTIDLQYLRDNKPQSIQIKVPKKLQKADL